MPINFLGKLLFPRLAPWQRKRQIKIMLWVILATVIFAASVAAIMLFQNSRK
jgi:flagellar basal body-associated protein FliL